MRRLLEGKPTELRPARLKSPSVFQDGLRTVSTDGVGSTASGCRGSPNPVIPRYAAGVFVSTRHS